MRSTSTSKLFCLFDDGCILSFPGLGIITITDFLSKQMCSTAHFGSSLISFGVIKSKPSDFLVFSYSLIAFVISLGRNSMGSCGGKSDEESK